MPKLKTTLIKRQGILENMDEWLLGIWIDKDTFIPLSNILDFCLGKSIILSITITEEDTDNVQNSQCRKV